jgi:hypothetical protein
MKARPSNTLAGPAKNIGFMPLPSERLSWQADM